MSLSLSSVAPRAVVRSLAVWPPNSPSPSSSRLASTSRTTLTPLIASTSTRRPSSRSSLSEPECMSCTRPKARAFSTTHRVQRPRHVAASSASASSESSPSSSAPSSSRSASSDFAFPTVPNPTPYDIFHFASRSVSPSEVKSRYYDLVKCLHPDRIAATGVVENESAKSKAKGKGKSSQAEENFKLVIQAYNLLKDPRKKEIYDRSGYGWNGNGGSDSSPFGGQRDPWRGWQDMRYTRRYRPGFGAHDQFNWQNSDFYSNQYRYHRAGAGGAGSAGWNGGNGQFTSNGIFISTLFVVTWVLAGLQYSRLSLQSQKAVERADRHHLNAAKSLHEARELARSEEGKLRLQAFRRRAREQKLLEEMEQLNLQQRRQQQQHSTGQADVDDPHRIGTIPHHHQLLSLPAPLDNPRNSTENPYGIGHGGPSGKQAAQERFQKAMGMGLNSVDGKETSPNPRSEGSLS